MSVDHYENFPVASWLCPPALRPPITAIYHFARTADDLADEGSAPPEQRRAWLQQLRDSWHAHLRGEPADPRWAAMLATLVREQRRHALPQTLLEDLLDAFRQDCGNPLYDSRDQLLDYCRRSANPIGRLLLHLYHVDEPKALQRSDDICTALQLINFWQDFSVDHPRGRCYLPAEDCARHGVDRAALLAGRVPGRTEAALLTDLLDWTEGLMRRGAPLVHQLPGRVGWELRAVVQGGLHVLATIRRMNPHSFQTRPQLRGADWLAIGWAALCMRRTVS
ncbi:squalene synthase HpnC [Ideonella aquatica]|uniref:squalene synthase HpnC n=1 Tax=Ideonella aquatica TaxID=2824119 RepID=UPI002873D29F|nr:squalene synthase HpnC [Ideonella aquatica]